MADLGTIGFASPLDADDTTYGDYFTDNTTGAGGSVAMDTTPADLGNVDTLTMSGIARSNSNFQGVSSGGDSATLGVRIMDGATVLAAASSGGAYQDTGQTWDVNTNGNDVSWTDVAFDYENTTATRSQWENATAEFQQTYTQVKGPDDVRLVIDHLTVGGTYTEASSNDLAANLQLIATVTPGLTGQGNLAATPDIVATVTAGVTAQGVLDAALSLVATVAADVTAPADNDLAATLSTILTVGADVTATGEIAALLNVALTQTASLSALGTLQAALSLVGTVAADVTQGGQLFIPRRIAHMENQSLDFDGDDTRLYRDVGFTDDGEATCMAWCRYDSPTIGEIKTPLTFGPTGGAQDREYLIDTDFSVALWAGGSVQNSTFIIRPGEWYHFAMSYDDGANRTILYVNGQEVLNTTTGNSVTGMERMNIAGFNGTGGEWLGQIQQVFAYDRVLTQDEIIAQMNQREPVDRKTLLSHVRPGPDTLTDQVSGSYTVVGTPAPTLVAKVPHLYKTSLALIGATAPENDLSASLSLALTASPAITALGSLTGALATNLNVAAGITAEGELASLIESTATVAGDIDAVGNLSTALSAAIDVAAQLDAVGQLSASNLLVATVAADLNGVGSLAAGLSVLATVSANVTEAGSSDLAAVLSGLLSVTPGLTAVGGITASPNAVLNVAAALDALGTIAASPTGTATIAAALNALGDLGATTEITGTLAAGITAEGTLASVLSTIGSVTANVTDAGNPDIAASLSATLSVAGALAATGQLEAAVDLAVAVAAQLAAVGKLDTAIDLSASVAADVAPEASITAQLQLNAETSPSITAEGELLTVLQINLTALPDLDAQGTIAATLLSALSVFAEVVDANAIVSMGDVVAVNSYLLTRDTKSYTIDPDVPSYQIDKDVQVKVTK